MAQEKTLLTIGEKIDRIRDGRTQKWVVRKMNEEGITISEVQFSNKKNGSDTFSDQEIKILSKILGTKLTA